MRTFALALALASGATIAADELPWPGFAEIDTGAGLSLHREMYALPAMTGNRYNGSESEVLFRLSAKVRILGSRFFFGYTQDSFWQAYNDSDSSPFRETNYNPEVFYRIAPSNSNLKRWATDFGLEHVSNGQPEPDSRSWNRAYVTVHRVAPRWIVSLKAWRRFEEDRCPIGDDGLEVESCRDDSSYDDNPDINDYMGYGELHLRYQWIGNEKVQRLHAMVRGNLATGKGAFELDYSYPASSKDLHWFAKFWHGYGESLIDHDRSVTRIGIGVLLRR